MTMSLPLVLAIVAAHFVADFLCQSDWMALNKSKRWDALGLHVAVYALVGLCPFVLLSADAALWIAVNAVAHFVQDAVTSRMTSRLWFFAPEWGIWEQAAYTVPKHGRTLVNPWTPIPGHRRHWFFVVIGLDQLLHYAVLFITADWWLA